MSQYEFALLRFFAEPRRVLEPRELQRKGLPGDWAERFCDVLAANVDGVRAVWLVYHVEGLDGCGEVVGWTQPRDARPFRPTKRRCPSCEGSVRKSGCSAARAVLAVPVLGVTQLRRLLRKEKEGRQE